MRVSRWLATLALAAGVVASSSSAAQASDGERLFREGRALLVEGRFAEACAKLEQSQRVEPRGGTLLNLAACHERLGKLAGAWQEFHDALTWARAEGHDDRAALAEQRIDAIEPRLAWLTVTVPPDAFAARPHVALDGAELPEKSVGERIPLDAGQHRLTARFADDSAWDKVLTIEEAERQTVVVRPVGAAAEWTPSAPPYPAPRADAPPAAFAPAPRDEGFGVQRTLGLVAGGTGLAASGVGVYLLVRASSQESVAKNLCANQLCTRVGLDVVHNAQGTNSAGLVVLSVGGALVAGGGLLYLTAPSPKEGTTASAVRLRAVVGPQSVVLNGSF